MTIKLRPWQKEAIQKSLDWYYQENNQSQFIINAAPGAGKTIAACCIAQKLIKNNDIDRVVIIAPRTEVVNQWASDFKLITNQPMSKVTAGDTDIDSLDVDICATWAAIQGLTEILKDICNKKRVLVICDEHHHAALEAAWGISADSAFTNSKYTLILTGTPLRSDGSKSVWLSYDQFGGIECDKNACYNLTYGEAVNLGYCRPCTFHRHEGIFTFTDRSGVIAKVSSKETKILDQQLKNSSSLNKTLDFYKSAKTKRYEKDEVTPLVDGYQGSMLSWGSKKLDEIRNIMPEAGGLVIAPDIEMAKYMAEIIEILEGEKPMLVHSQMPNADNKINIFRDNPNKRWIVSVAMISEGVDIKRLRVLVYLPNALTNLAFRQAIGRVVRTNGPDDITRAYVIMPSLETLEDFARKIEKEIPPTFRKEEKINYKVCPQCHNKCKLKDKSCNNCGYKFKKRNVTRTKVCMSCKTLNPINAEKCIKCSKPFNEVFDLSLDEALREGVIVRGIDVNEKEVQESEALEKAIHEEVLREGDGTLIEILRVIPPESLSRIIAVANRTRGSDEN